jgi:tetratricopeptide (TPR) repeat protein
MRTFARFAAALTVALTVVSTSAAELETQPKRMPLKGSGDKPSQSLNNALDSFSEALYLGTVTLMVESAAAKVVAGDHEGAIRDFEAVISQPVFERASTELQYRSYVGLAFSEAMLGKDADGYEHLIRAGQVAPFSRNAGYWRVMATVAANLERDDDLVNAATILARDYPSTLADWEDWLVPEAWRSARRLPRDSEARIEWLEALWAHPEFPIDPYRNYESIWLDLLTAYAERGLEGRAQEVVIALEDPDSLAVLSFDKRLEKFAVADPRAYYSWAQNDQIIAARSMVAERPRELRAVLRLGTRLARANRLEEGLRVFEDALARTAEAGLHDGASIYDDIDEYQHWIMNYQARILSKLGRWDEAVKAQSAALEAARIHGSDNLSQQINLGVMHYMMGKPADALEALDGSGDLSDPKSGLSDYGRMAAEAVRVCAYEQLGDSEKREQSLAYIREHALDGYVAVKEALLCAGDLDGLAQVIIEHLEDPLRRNEILRDLQVYYPVPNLTPFGQTIEERFQALRDRQDVREAAGKVGSILSWPAFPQDT